MALALTLLGFILEVAGFILVALAIDRLQQRELGEAGWLARTERWVRAKLGLRRDHHITLEGVSEVGVAGEVARVERTYAPVTLLEDKVRRLEAVTEALQRELGEAEARLESRVREVGNRLGAFQAELSRQQQEEEQKRKETVRDQLRMEGWGVALFLAGLAASVAGNIWAL